MRKYKRDAVLQDLTPDLPPKQSWPSSEVNSEVVTGELIDTETVTISSEGGR